MKKTPFVTKQQVEEIVKQFPTPFHLYDEAGIRANAQAVKDAFAWNPGFREYFAELFPLRRSFMRLLVLEQIIFQLFHTYIIV